MSTTATLRGVGREEEARAPAVDYTDAVGHTHLSARHRQKPDSVYQQHYTDGADPVLANATVEEIEYPTNGFTGRQMLPNSVHFSVEHIDGSTTDYGLRRTWPDFGNDRDRYKVAGYAGEPLPVGRPFADITTVTRTPAYGVAALIAVVVGLLLLLGYVVGQVVFP